MSILIDDVSISNGWKVLTIPIRISHTKNVIVRKKGSDVVVVFYTTTRLIGSHSHNLEEKCEYPLRDTTSPDGWRMLHVPIWLNDTTCLILKEKDNTVCGMYYHLGQMYFMFFQEV